MTRMILEVIFIFMVAGMGYRMGFIEGVEEERFDRETANNKLQNCLAVVRQ